MSGENRFPEELLLNEPDRGHRLIREFYQHYADIAKTPNYYTEIGPQHEKIKTTFYRRWLERNGHDQRSLGLDVGCRPRLVLPVRKWILLPPSTFKMRASMQL